MNSRKTRIIAVACMMLSDFMAFFVSFLIADCCLGLLGQAAALQSWLYSASGWNPHWFIGILGCTIFLFKKSYVRYLSYMQEAVEIVRISSVLFLGVGFLVWGSPPFSILWLVIAWLNSLYLLPALRYLTKTGLIKTGLWDIPLESVVWSSGKIVNSVQLPKDSCTFLNGLLIKRLLDILLASAVLLLGFLPLLLIGAIVKIDSPGPVFFAHTRVGKEGKPFKCWKFRTMYQRAEEVLLQLLAENPVLKREWEEVGKLKNDPRVTPMGKFLRKTSLDEIPQLFNVLLGEMSLVGPRPLSPRWLSRYGPDQSARLRVRPGLTGLWQVSGRNDLEYEQRIRLDNWYLQNWSIWLDIIIVLRTVVVVLTGRGAY